MVVNVPFYRLFHPSFQIVLWLVTQFVDGGLDIASPVALAQNIILVVIQGCYFTCHSSNVFSEESHDAQHPYWGCDTDPPRAPQFFMNQIAEGGTLIDLPITEEKLPSVLSFLQCQEGVGINTCSCFAKGRIS